MATTWGTFLHAAGAVQVLIVLSALLALDAGIARLGRRLGWTRPVAWLGPALGIFGSVLFSVVLLTGFAVEAPTGPQPCSTNSSEGWQRSAIRLTRPARS